MRGDYIVEEKYGEQVEINFKNHFESKGFIVKDSSKNDNMINHIDYIITRDNQSVTVDVKGEKKTNRYDTNYNNDLIWVELKNIYGYNGWLYGKANFIAFQMGDKYLLVQRLKLVEGVEKELNKMNGKKGKGLYLLYNRYNRPNEMTTQIPKSLIEECGGKYY